MLFFHLKVLIEMTDMWYKGMAFFEVCFLRFSFWFFFHGHSCCDEPTGRLWEGFMASKRDLKTIRMHTFVVHYGRRGVSRYLDHRGPKES